MRVGEAVQHAGVSGEPEPAVVLQRPGGVWSPGALAALRAALAALLLACGGDGVDAPARRILRVAASGDYPPFTELVAATEHVAVTEHVAASASTRESYRGFDAEIARRFAEHHGFEIEWVRFRWPELSRLLAAGAFDVGMSGITVRPERSVVGRFTVPVAETGAVVLVRASGIARGGSAERLDDLDLPGVTIAVNAGGHLERITRARFRAAEIRAIPDNGAVRDALLSGEVDAVVTDTLEAPRWMRGREDLHLVGPFTRDRKAYLLPAGRVELAVLLDDWLLAAERDGTLAQLRLRYFGAGSASAEPLAALLAAADERLSLMPFVADAKRRSAAPLLDPEREVRVLAAAQAAVALAAESIGVGQPSPLHVAAFYRAQIDAAVEIQTGVLADPRGAGREALELVTELRPALLRIGERMARLFVRVSLLSEPPDLSEQVRTGLARHELSEPRLEAIAAAIAAVMRPAAADRQRVKATARDASALGATASRLVPVSRPGESIRCAIGNSTLPASRSKTG